MPARNKRCALCCERYKLTEMQQVDIVNWTKGQIYYGAYACQKCLKSDSRKKRVL